MYIFVCNTFANIATVFVERSIIIVEFIYAGKPFNRAPLRYFELSSRLRQGHRCGFCGFIASFGYIVPSQAALLLRIPFITLAKWTIFAIHSASKSNAAFPLAVRERERARARRIIGVQEGGWEGSGGTFNGVTLTIHYNMNRTRPSTRHWLRKGNERAVGWQSITRFRLRRDEHALAEKSPHRKSHAHKKIPTRLVRRPILYPYTTEDSLRLNPFVVFEKRRESITHNRRIISTHIFTSTWMILGYNYYFFLLFINECSERSTTHT